MGLFNNILEKLGFNRPGVQAAPVTPAGGSGHNPGDRCRGQA